jgi:hypothetical protein
MKIYKEVQLHLHVFLISPSDKCDSQLEALTATSKESAPSIHQMGVCVGPTASLDTVEKRKISILPLLGIEPRFLSHPTHSIVCIPIELLQLPLCKYILGKIKSI